MADSDEAVLAAEAARRLGVSVKALRHYEARGLLAPRRTGAGWRAYGAAEMARAGEIVALRALGLSLAEVARVLDGDPAALGPALEAHAAALEGRARALAETAAQVRALREALAQGQAPGRAAGTALGRGAGTAAAQAGEQMRAAAELARLMPAAPRAVRVFSLPWPWDGERFALPEPAPITFLTGPLGSGKTRLARRIAEVLPGAAFLGLERAGAEGAAAAEARPAADPARAARARRALDWLAGDGARPTPALGALLAALLEGTGPLVVDLVEEGLDAATQGALMAYLRGRPEGARALYLMTRSTAILDLEAVGAGEEILLCPANHSPPVWVRPYPGTPGYEAVATALAPPAVRARSAGVVAVQAPAG